MKNQPTKETLIKFARRHALDIDGYYQDEKERDPHKREIDAIVRQLKAVRKQRDSFRKQRDELINDMRNVKRKAEAWIDLKKEMIEMYPVLVIDVETTSGECEKGMLYQLGKHLKRMDELDGTNDFKNLLSDLERGSDE